MTADFLRRYYILSIIKNPIKYSIDTDQYVSLEQLQRALENTMSQNLHHPLYAKLDSYSQKNVKRDLDKILSFTGVEIEHKRNFGYFIKSIEEGKADLLKELYEKTELFLLETKNREWQGYISPQNTSLDGRFDFSKIIYAIENHLQIHIKFSGWYDNNKFENLDLYVQPLHLKEAHKHWHLVAHHEKHGIYSFSLDDRIEELIITKKKVEHPVSFNAQEYFKNSIGILVDDTPTEKIIIKVANHHFKYLMIRKMHASQRVIEMPKSLDTNELDYNNPDIWGAIEVTLQPNYEFLMEILQYNRWVKVISPKHVADDIVFHLKKSLEYYQ
ncbi:YafY family protein [Lentimicrobium sp. S6]|uniref:helix-turn-helix transcriptional regulator n=1 Tax=Lentimicrobium sp. S6 TaxID=2735872 RepID=UPI001553F2BB|nr:WYL domain-containing protein [Lentimicrobium sp. S6]NPD46901.1 WYL domain-containing protein [Lentimicrobium sp. S6]